MKIIRYLILLICSLAVQSVNAQSRTFAKTIGYAVNDIGNFVQPTQDGGYIICGAKGNAGSTGYYDFLLAKLDAFGNVQWSKAIGDSLHDEQAQCVRQLPDGSYIVYGSKSSSTNSTGWLVKTDANGNKLWATEQQGSNAGRYGYAVLPSPNGGFQTASYDNGSGTNDYFQLSKTDTLGTIQWGPINALKGLGFSSSLGLTKDNNYICTGTTAVEYDSIRGNFFSCIALMKVNTAGAILWSKKFKMNPGTSGYNYLQGFGVDATADGGYIICGSTNIQSKGGTDIFLLKTNGNGDSLWSRNYGGSSNDVALSVKESPEGGYILTGNTKSFGSGSTDIFMLRTTATGDSLWMRTFGGAGTETAGSIAVTPDSGFVIAGTTASFGAGQGDMFILRTDRLGRIPDATIHLSGSPSVCNGTVTLTAIGGYTYLWNTGATTQSIVATQTGNYSVTLRDNYNNSNISKASTIFIDHPITAASFTNSGAATFCQGNSALLLADSVPGYIYQWKNNDYEIPSATSRRFSVTESGYYSVMISNSCNTAASQGLNIQVLASPPVPTVSLSGKDLVSSSSINNQWYKDGNMIKGATNATYTPTQNGSYAVAVSNENCTSVSLSYTISTVGVNESEQAVNCLIYPNPVDNILHIQYRITSDAVAWFLLYSVDGKLIYRQQLDGKDGLAHIDCSSLTKGLYISCIEAAGSIYRSTVAILH